MEAKQTEARHKRETENVRYTELVEKIENDYRRDREISMDRLMSFDSSDKLKACMSHIDTINKLNDQKMGLWGEYSIPENMPDSLPLVDTVISLPADDEDETGDIHIPYEVDLDHANIIVITGENRYGSTSAQTDSESLKRCIARQFIAELIKTVPPGLMNMNVFDPLYNGASLESLIDITNLGTLDLGFDLFTGNDNSERLKYLNDRLSDIIRKTAGMSRSLYEYNKMVSADRRIPLTWIVDFDFSEQSDIYFDNYLRGLFINAERAGYSFVFVTNPAGYLRLKNIAVSSGSINMIHLDCMSGTLEAGARSLEFTKSASPDPHQIRSFMASLKSFYDEKSARNNSISEVFKKNGVDLKSAAAGLNIPAALDGQGNLVNICLGGEGSIHGFISGGTNSGKSTLLHTIILSACMHYRPDDLEILLADYKMTEFHLYRRYPAPHIKLIGVSQTEDFTFSLLDHIEEEAERRTYLFSRFEVQNLTEYRKHKGEEGYEECPRILIVIDEFHRMSQHVAEVPEYKDKLENLLREYRAQGINCLLADQTFSTGLNGLTPAAKNQIGLRIALRNEALNTEVMNTLEVGPAYYSDSFQKTISSMRQGDFIMKVYMHEQQGYITDIRLEKFRGLKTVPEDIASVGRVLADIYKEQISKDGRTGPLYINTKEQTEWSIEEAQALDRSRELIYPDMRVYLGKTASLEPCFAIDLSREPDENISIVGGSARQRMEIISAAIDSVKYRGYKLYLFAASHSDIMREYKNVIREKIADIPNAEFVADQAGWERSLASISAKLDRASDDNSEIVDTICIFIGLESIGREPNPVKKALIT